MAKPFHPPQPSPYVAPTSDQPGYLLGASGVQGFGKRDLYLAAIPAARAREVIISRHYSRRVVNNSYVHLDVYHQGQFRGVLQFGYALCPHRAGKVVEGRRWANTWSSTACGWTMSVRATRRAKPSATR